MHVHVVWGCMWRPKVNVRIHPGSLFLLTSEAGSLSQTQHSVLPLVLDSCQVSGDQNHGRLLSPPGLYPPFTQVSGDVKLGSQICGASTLTPEPCHQPIFLPFLWSPTATLVTVSSRWLKVLYTDVFPTLAALHHSHYFACEDICPASTHTPCISPVSVLLPRTPHSHPCFSSPTSLLSFIPWKSFSPPGIDLYGL